MKVIDSNLLDPESSNLSSSKSAGYEIYDKINKNSYLNIENKVLSYIEKSKNDNLIKAIYQDPITKSLSSELRINLIYYYVFIFSYILILSSFTILLYNYNCMPNLHLKIHLACLAVLASFSIMILFFLFKSEKALLKSRNIFLALSSSICLYLILGDERILHKFTNEPLLNTIQPYSLGIISMIVISRWILFDYYHYICILGLSTSVIFIITHIVLRDTSIYVILSEISIVLLFICIQIIECYNSDLIIKQLFWKKNEEEQKKNLQYLSEVQVDSLEINTEVDDLLQKCNSIALNIKDISRIVIYKNVKKLLNKSLISLEKIREDIINGKFDLCKIDFQEDEKVCIYEGGWKSTSVKDYFLNNNNQDIEESIAQLSPQKSKVDEIQIMLEDFGKNWNFDIWSIYESTKHSVSIIGIYIIKKYNLVGILETSKEIIEKYFQELESVIYI